MKFLRHVLRSVPILVGLFIYLAPQASAQQNPPGCNGSGIQISIQAFFANGSGAVGTPATPCETIVYRASLAYALNPAGNCAFQDGALIITTPDGVEHNVTPPGGINVGGAPLSPTDPGPIIGTPDITYVINAADITGQCAGGTNNGTTCQDNSVCTGGGTCQNLQVIASTSYNQSPNFPKGISFTGTPPSVGFNNGGSSIGVTVSPCPNTFCAPQLCDPNAVTPAGRKGACILAPPPVCPDNLPCEIGVCDANVQACALQPILPPPAVCTPGNCGNNGRIRRAAMAKNARAAGDPDRLSVALRTLPLPEPIDPTGKEVTVSVSNDAGEVFTATLPAGSVHLSGRYYRYLNNAAKKDGGIFRLSIFRRFRGRNQIKVEAYGDLGGASSAMMTSVTVGDTVYNHDGTWRPVGNGWKTP